MATEDCDKWFDELMEHIKGGNVERVAELLRVGHDVNRVSEEERLSPLSLACQYGHLEMARLLLEHGADVSVPGKLFLILIFFKFKLKMGLYEFKYCKFYLPWKMWVSASSVHCVWMWLSVDMSMFFWTPLFSSWAVFSCFSLWTWSFMLQMNFFGSGVTHD